MIGKRVLDQGTLGGVVLALFGIAAGLWLEGGSASQIVQPTAALIVLVGTLGATLSQYPFKTFKEALQQLKDVLFHVETITPAYIDEVVAYCGLVRRYGWMSLDAQLNQIANPFLRKCLTLAVDGLNETELRIAMEIDLDLQEERDENVVSVWNTAGGFAPTLGIIGAVLGLIQVMQRMDNFAEIGRGIAVAFVSTLYGIGAANLVFLPWAGKLKIRARERQMMREMTLDAVLFMLQGINPRGLRERIESYAPVKVPRSRPQPAVELNPS